MLVSWPDGDDERARALAELAKQTARSVMMTGLASEAEVLLREGCPSPGRVRLLLVSGSTRAGSTNNGGVAYSL